MSNNRLPPATPSTSEKPDDGSLPNRTLILDSVNVLNQKVSLILSAVRTLEPLAFEGSSNEWKNSSNARTHDGGASDAAQASLIGVLDRLDKIMGNDQYWEIDRFDKHVERTLEELHVENIAVLKGRQRLIIESNRPSVIFGAKVFQMPDGRIGASLDNPLRHDSLVCYGTTIAEALVAFDKAFTQ